MLCKRIIACLDIDRGRVVKGTNFRQLRDIGDPVELARTYEQQGVDELVMLDISASREGRGLLLEMVSQLADQLSIPFTVGGGVRSLDDVRSLLQAGADKVSVNSAAVERPDLIAEIAAECGSQCCVLAVDARRQAGSWQVLTHGGSRTTSLDAVAWCRQGQTLGCGEILLTSWDRDGTRQGFDIALCQAVNAGLDVPLVASGGAADAASFIELFKSGCADAALAAGVFHEGSLGIGDLKRELNRAGVPVRMEEMEAGTC